MMVIEGTPPTLVQKVKDRNDMDPMWVQENTLLNSDGDMVGKINRDQSIMKRFIIEVPKS